MLALDRHRRQRSLGNFRPPESRREISSPIVTQKTGTISWQAITTQPRPIDDVVPSSGVAATITVADAAGDTTTFPLLAGSATGDLPALTDAGLTYNANTNALTATTFVGAVTGNAATATLAATVTVADAAGDTTTFPMLAGSATGSLPVLTDPGLSYNANTNALTATTFVGALTGTASGNDVLGSAAAAQAASQPLDSDLTAVAALTAPATTITNSTPYAFNMALILDT